MRRWTGPVALLLVASFLIVGPVARAPRALASCATTGCAAPVPCNSHPGGCWMPSTTARWQYQLQAAKDKSGNCLFPTTGGINVGITGTPFTGGAAVSPTVFDIDFQTDGACTGGTISQQNTAAVAAIHGLQGGTGKAICYIDAGGAESFRPDFTAYQTFNNNCGGCLFGKPIGGFRNEFWLNINNDQGQRNFILGQISARLDHCVTDGFDGVEMDVVDAWSNRTGLTITPDTQLLFNTALANLAHSKGLTVALKNDVEQIPDLAPYFDYAINEQCQQYSECGNYTTYFANAGKAVFQVEYKLKLSTFCPPANAANRNAILKTFDLFDTPWTPCR
jgi:Glycoside-hydrolase family GH114